MAELNSIPLVVETHVEDPTEATQPVVDQEAIDEAAQKAKAEEEAAQKAASEAAAVLRFQLPDAEHDGAPYWARIPPNFVFPRGKQVIFMRFKSTWTDTPWKGEPIIDKSTGVHEIDADGKVVLYRQCVCWPINMGDKKLALSRALRDPNRAADELSKQMVRAVDGAAVDWTVARENGIEVFWNELGERCRTLLQRVFSQLHVLDLNATRDFLQNCIAVRSTAG